MKQLLFALGICALVVPALALAQGEPGFHKSSLGANFEVSVPTDDLFKELAGTGYGGNIKYQYGMDARGVVTATAGYMVWGKKDIGQSASVQPKAFTFLVGGKYYFTKGLYGSLEGGVYFFTYTYEGTVAGAQGNTGWFMVPIGLGYQQSGFEIGVRYMLLAVDYNSFSFTLGYNFTL